jgi:hypothetical protein
LSTGDSPKEGAPQTEPVDGEMSEADAATHLALDKNMDLDQQRVDTGDAVLVLADKNVSKETRPITPSLLLYTMHLLTERRFYVLHAIKIAHIDTVTTFTAATSVLKTYQ